MVPLLGLSRNTPPSDDPKYACDEDYGYGLHLWNDYLNSLSLKMKSPVKDLDVKGIWLLYRYENITSSKSITLCLHPLLGMV